MCTVWPAVVVGTGRDSKWRYLVKSNANGEKQGKSREIEETELPSRSALSPGPYNSWRGNFIACLALG
jgi:hypothetical protein